MGADNKLKAFKLQDIIFRDKSTQEFCMNFNKLFVLFLNRPRVSLGIHDRLLLAMPLCMGRLYCHIRHARVIL